MAERRPPRGTKPPQAAFKDLIRRFGIPRGELHEALEAIKDSAGLPAPADTCVDSEGNVYIERTGEWIGNLIDEK